MQKLIHFTQRIIPNKYGFNNEQGVDGNIIVECGINRDTHTYNILNMSQSNYMKNDNVYVVTTLLIEIVSKQNL